MTPHCFPYSGGRRAFTLIEMIGVLAVMAILAAVLVPALLKEMDKAVADQETATLQSFSTALQNNILRNRSIPSETNWADTIAAELGMNVSDVATNIRHQPRIFLIERSGWFATNAAAYVQNSGGASTNAGRLMILSALGSVNVPFTSGRPNLTDFRYTWNSRVGTVPDVGIWTGWQRNSGGQGDPNDVLVQRINLGSSFVHLLLNNSDPTNAPYSIDGITTNYLSPTNPLLDAYFLTGTVFKLYLANGNLEASQVLLQDSSWWFTAGIWRNSSLPAGSTPGVGLQPIVQTFFTNSPHNTFFPGVVYSNMTNYMGSVIQYGFTNFISVSAAGSLANSISTNNLFP